MENGKSRNGSSGRRKVVMEKYSFRVTIETNEQNGNVVAVYFQVRKGKSVKIKEFCDGNAFADYDRRGRLLGVELLAPCEARILDKIAPGRLPKAFIRKSIPHQMMLTNS
jgi:hypothetical protein